MRKIDIVVAGHICLDIIPGFIKTKQRGNGNILIPGKLINIDKPTISTGGVVSNTGIVISRLGVKVELIAKVGDDLFGDIIINIMKNSTGIKCSGISKTKNESTSYTIVLSPPGIDRIFLHFCGTNSTFGYKNIRFDIVKNAKIFHFGYPSLMRRMYLNNGKELIQIYKKVKELRCITSLDPAFPDPDSEAGKANWEKILKGVLPYVDIFLPSLEESCFMINKALYYLIQNKSGHNDAVDYYKQSDISNIAKTFIRYGAKNVLLKCGHRGLYFTDKNKEIWSPSYKAKKIVSATGSGDCAVAGFLAGVLKGASVENSMKYANAAGLLNLSAYDAVSGIKNWNQILKTVKNRGV